MLIASFALLLPGCGATQRQYSPRPQTQWPGATDRPRQRTSTTVSPPTRPTPPASQPTAQRHSSLNAVPRSQWAAAGPIPARVNPMNGVTRITVHHEGWTTFFHTDFNTTASRIEQIRQTHIRDRGWGDIGYHYIICRAGRVWDARPTQYQGAHVGGHNENNLGIMLLGNFDQQRPSDAQLNSLLSTLRALMQTHNVPTHRVYTHQELAPSACPGLNLQPRVVALRRGGQLA